MSGGGFGGLAPNPASAGGAATSAGVNNFTGFPGVSSPGGSGVVGANQRQQSGGGGAPGAGLGLGGGPGMNLLTAAANQNSAFSNLSSFSAAQAAAAAAAAGGSGRLFSRDSRKL